MYQPYVCVLLLMCVGISSLPAQPHPPRCGTFLYLQMQEQETHVDSTLQPQPIPLQILTRYEELDTSIISQGDHFRIHYDRSGPNAPSQIDRNSNGIPDYIDSVDYYMEYAWKVEIEECGYIAPPSDNMVPGTGGMDGRIDVYIINLGAVFYGLAYTDTPITPSRSTSYVILDNDYQGYPTPGIEGLRVSTAHEFHHVVQFASYRVSSQASLHEATATWMEYKVHPDVSDYRLSFDALLNEPQQYGFSTHNSRIDGVTGYAHMHYLQSLVKQLDETVIRDIWDEFKVTGKSFDAINKTLLKTGSGLNLSNSYCTFARWSYHTGIHSTKEETYFAKPEQYRTINPAQIRLMPDEETTSFIGSLIPLSFGIWRLIIPRKDGFSPDTLDFLLTNARSDLGSGGRHWIRNSEPFMLDISTEPQPNYLPVTFRNEQIWYRLTAPHQNFCAEVIVNGSPGITTIVLPTPQPFYNDGADRMLFAVTTDAETVVTSASLDIYSASMTRIAHKETTGLETLNNMSGIIWDGRNTNGMSVSSGVYIYTLQINGEEPSIGKFAVVKQ